MRLNSLSSLLLAFSLFLGSAASSFSLTLKTGDILLQSVPCYLCSLIEFEENSTYSHMGIVVVEENGVSVFESWQKVEKISLRDFLNKKKADSQTLILRPTAFANATASISAKSMVAFFNRWFAGKHYDDDFAWNNSDELGEKYYCSEFVAKFLNHFLPVPFSPKPMHFQKYRAEWIKYFRGTPPDGMPGISPGDFERSPLVTRIGYL
jgi:hypothetical protein